MCAKKYKGMSSWVAASGIVVCVLNSLLLMTAADYLFFQVDLFGLIWMSLCFVGVVTVPWGWCCLSSRFSSCAPVGQK